MEKPNAQTTAAFERLIPDDPRAVRGQMFGHPCAFVHGNMFFGTFADILIARVGQARAAVLVAEGQAVLFSPMEGRTWKEYVQVSARAGSGALHRRLAKEALEHTAGLPPKAKKGKKA